MTALVSSADVNYDTETAIVLGILCLIALAFWAAAEFQLRRDLDALSEEWRAEDDRDAIAETIGLIDQRRKAAYADEFANAIEQRLTVIDGGAS